MDWLQSLDRYLTTPPHDGFDDFCEAVIEALPDEFYNPNEDWIHSEECDKLLIECYKKGMSDADTVQHIQKYKL